MNKKFILLITALLTSFLGEITAYPTSIAQPEEDPPFFSDEHYSTNTGQDIEIEDAHTINIEVSNEVDQ